MANNGCKIVRKRKQDPVKVELTTMFSMSDEFYVDHGHLEKANSAWQRMGRATKRNFVEDRLD